MIIARTESTAASASDFFNSVWAATFSINCCFVILFEFNGLRGEARSASQIAVIIPTPSKTELLGILIFRKAPEGKKMARPGVSGAFPWSKPRVILTAADVVAAALDELPAEIRSMRQSSPQEWPEQPPARKPLY